MTEQALDRERRTSPQESDLGDTRIEDTVVAKLAGIATREVEGIEMRRSSTAPAVRSLFAGGGGGTGEDLTRGVHAEVGQGEAAVDLTIAVGFGRSIPLVTDAVRRNVISRVEGLLGLRVTRVDVNVVDVLLGEDTGAA